MGREEAVGRRGLGRLVVVRKRDAVGRRHSAPAKSDR